VALLARRYPEALEAASAGNAEHYAAALADGGYYTASEASYAAGLERWRAHFEDGAPPPVADSCIEIARAGVLHTLARASQD